MSLKRYPVLSQEDKKLDNRQVLKTKNLSISGRRTSMRLEPVMWDALHDICIREKKKLADVCEIIDRHRGDLTLTSTLRLFMVCYFRSISKRSSPFLDSLPSFVDKAIKGEMDLVAKRPQAMYNPRQKNKKRLGKTKNDKVSLE